MNRDVRSDGGSRYVNPTGRGYHTTRRVGTSGLGISIADTDLDWQEGDTVFVSERARHLVISPDTLPSRAVIATSEVHPQQCAALHVSLPTSVLKRLGVDADGEVRVYEDDDTLVVVDADNDPRVPGPGGEAGGD